MECSSFRTRISGLVSWLRTRDIRSDRCDGVRVSVISEVALAQNGPLREIASPYLLTFVCGETRRGATKYEDLLRPVGVDRLAG